MATLIEEAATYQDDESFNWALWQHFTSLVNADPMLDAHRTWVEHNIFGFGDRAFHWLWKLIVDDLDQSVRSFHMLHFLEIGVFRGQTLSLFQLLCNRVNREAVATGITPLSSYSGERGEFPPHWESDYKADIERMHREFNLPFDAEKQLIVGLSTDPAVTARAQDRAPYDVVYIDGCHEYWAVHYDLEHYAPMVKPGGFLVVDDSSNYLHMWQGSFPGIVQVSQAVRDVIDPDPQWKHLLAVMHLRVWRREK